MKCTHCGNKPVIYSGIHFLSIKSALVEDAQKYRISLCADCIKLLIPFLIDCLSFDNYRSTLTKYGKEIYATRIQSNGKSNEERIRKQKRSRNRSKNLEQTTQRNR